MRAKSIAVFLVAAMGWFVASPEGAEPSFDAPMVGGLPACMADLDVCNTDLGVCDTDLSRTTVDLATCSFDLGTCVTDLGVCGSDLGACAGELGTCTGDLGACNSELGACGSDLGACDADLVTCTSNLTQATEILAGCEAELFACQESEVVFPATGQTSCWTQGGEMIDCSAEAGEDGYFEAGGALAYIWNDDGTLEDVNTRLMWERKDMSGGIHDMDLTYRWVQTFRDHIHALNNTCLSDETVDCSAGGDSDCEAALGAGEVCGFAGYRDWRMPNVKEIQSIIDYSGVNPPVSMPFNYMCGEGCSLTECSCTSRGLYWTSTTYIPTPDRAWFVTNSGSIQNGWQAPGGTALDKHKYGEARARAVRGGL